MGLIKSACLFFVLTIGYSSFANTIEIREITFSEFELVLNQYTDSSTTQFISPALMGEILGFNKRVRSEEMKDINRKLLLTLSLSGAFILTNYLIYKGVVPIDLGALDWAVFTIFGGGLVVTVGLVTYLVRVGKYKQGTYEGHERKWFQRWEKGTHIDIKKKTLGIIGIVGGILLIMNS